MTLHIGFVSTRFRGTDGVTLESSKWADIFDQAGHRCFWCAGELDRSADSSFLIPEAHFQYPDNLLINAEVFGRAQRSAETTSLIHRQRQLIKNQLRHFISEFQIDMLVVQNALSLPMHIPLGLALTEILAEMQMPAIAHHHDFSWERDRYSINAVGDYLRMAFPPVLPRVCHVVINTAAQQQLALRSGAAANVIPNVLDFDQPPVIDEQKVQAFRSHLGLDKNDVVILQPTRVVQRKAIEQAVNLIRALDRPNCKLIVSHEAGDEGMDYADWLADWARQQGVTMLFVGTRMADPWGTEDSDRPPYSLWDIYPMADFVTYPSTHEGFGNAFLEAIYFRKPMLVNRYATFIEDIEPLGFHLITMNGYLPQYTVDQVARVLSDPMTCRQMTENNYAIAQKHFSYSLLRRKLDAIMADLLPDMHLTMASGKRLNPRNLVYLHVENCPQKQGPKKARQA